MKNELFPTDLPADITNRFDGLLDDLHSETRSLLKEPSIDDLIEECMDVMDGWSDDLISDGTPGVVEYEGPAARSVHYQLHIISILSKLKRGEPVTV